MLKRMCFSKERPAPLTGVAPGLRREPVLAITRAPGAR